MFLYSIRNNEDAQETKPNENVSSFSSGMFLQFLLKFLL